MCGLEEDYQEELRMFFWFLFLSFSIQRPLHISAPISLCIPMHKVITKVITNRLKDVMSDLIAPAQLSFIPGRHMIDNVVIC